MFGFGTKYWNISYSTDTPYGKLILMSVSDLGTPDEGDYICLITGTELDQGKTLSARFRLEPSDYVMSELKNSSFKSWFAKYGKLLSEWWMKNNRYNASMFVATLWQKCSDLARERTVPAMYFMPLDLEKQALYR